MSGFFQQFLKGAGDGFFGSPYLRDYTHASNIFRRDAYGNAPKFKWLFHVYFDINKNEIADIPEINQSFNQKNTAFPVDFNPGLLVKSIDLPKYTLATQELNQYNRKRYVHTKITYDPVRIVFHDDNNNQIRHMWHAYYGYYFNDPSQPYNQAAKYSRDGDTKAASTLNIRNTYSPVYNNANWGYSAELTNANATLGSPLQYKVPFFKSIRIYGFNQHNFALYVLINPIINSFTHDNYTYYDSNSTMENSMSINYESVKYYDGALNGQDPGSIVHGFGEDNVYDKTLSPIARPGSNRTILGQGGLADAGVGVLENLSGDNPNVLGAVQIAGRTARTFRNGNDISRAARSEAVSEVIGAINNPAGSRSRFNIPAAGATTGVGSQLPNATNIRNVFAPPVPVPDNRPIAPIERRT